MLVIEGRNVNDLYFRGVNNLMSQGQRQTSRNGDVLVAPYPVMSVYGRPYERVLFDPVRDANPFFHLMECIWMMAGRNDSGFLNTYVKDFGSRFAESDGRLHGAYGYRWRNHFGHGVPYVSGIGEGVEFEYLDQITYCVDALRKNHDDRRVVISMWDPEVDLGAQKKDLPCNTQLYPRVVNGALDLTVMCRSNDIIWGAYGANAVHFSFLQEVMAAGIGVNVGKMYQLSNNWHGYCEVMDKQKVAFRINHYENGSVVARPLVSNYEYFLMECEAFCAGVGADKWHNHFFPETAIPMREVHNIYRSTGPLAALNECHFITASDWRFAAKQWLQKRIK